MTDCDNFVELTFSSCSIYARILNLLNKLNPKKGCSAILPLPTNEREWNEKYAEKAELRFSIFTVLLYLF